MAGVLNFTPTPIFRPVSTRRATNGRVFLVKSSANASETSISAPPNFKAPQPKPFSVRPDKVFDILGASLALLFRLTTSVLVSGYSVTLVPAKEIPSDQYALGFAGFKLKETSKLGARPEKPIEIYEFESCPFCRKVREIVSFLDLDVLYYPCPKNGPNFRPKVSQMGGKQQFPYMVDPNTGVSMYESDDIIKYLVRKYGDGNVPLLLSLGLLTTLTEGFAMIGRLGKGSSYTPSKLPPKPLEIWAYEASPFCKVVREVLVELELPHILHSCARGSPKRQTLYQKVGHFQVPYLEDPNTGVQMFESAEIVEYLKEDSLQMRRCIDCNKSPGTLLLSVGSIDNSLQYLPRDCVVYVGRSEIQFVAEFVKAWCRASSDIEQTECLVCTVRRNDDAPIILVAFPLHSIEENILQVRSISREQVQALKASLDTRRKTNARPSQPRSG